MIIDKNNSTLADEADYTIIVAFFYLILHPFDTVIVFNASGGISSIDSMSLGEEEMSHHSKVLVGGVMSFLALLAPSSGEIEFGELFHPHFLFADGTLALLLQPLLPTLIATDVTTSTVEWTLWLLPTDRTQVLSNCIR